MPSQSRIEPSEEDEGESGLTGGVHSILYRAGVQSWSELTNEQPGKTSAIETPVTASSRSGPINRRIDHRCREMYVMERTRLVTSGYLRLEFFIMKPPTIPAATAIPPTIAIPIRPSLETLSSIRVLKLSACRLPGSLSRSKSLYLRASA